jgi:hypothetical protein
MKRLCGIAFIAALSIAIPSIANACEITVAVEGVQKEKYNTGDIVILKITVVLQHRNCEVSVDQTDIRVSGSQITGATKWATPDGRTWERKIRVKIVDDKTGKAVITAERTCEKDGGKGSLTLLTVS